MNAICDRLKKLVDEAIKDPDNAELAQLSQDECKRLGSHVPACETCEEMLDNGTFPETIPDERLQKSIQLLYKLFAHEFP